MSNTVTQEELEVLKRFETINGEVHVTINSAPVWLETVWASIRDGKRVRAVQELRECTDFGLKLARDVVWRMDECGEYNPVACLQAQLENKGETILELRERLDAALAREEEAQREHNDWRTGVEERIAGLLADAKANHDVVFALHARLQERKEKRWMPLGTQPWDMNMANVRIPKDEGDDFTL